MFMDIVEATGSIITVGRLLPHHLFHRQFVVTRLLGVANRVPFHEVYGRRIPPSHARISLVEEKSRQVIVERSQFILNAEQRILTGFFNQPTEFYQCLIGYSALDCYLPWRQSHF